MNVCVFLSAADLDQRYTRPAREFAELLGKGGHTLVWGGSDMGLMQVVADGVQESGGRLLGVSVNFLREWARSDADEMVFAAMRPTSLDGIEDFAGRPDLADRSWVLVLEPIAESDRQSEQRFGETVE